MTQLFLFSPLKETYDGLLATKKNRSLHCFEDALAQHMQRDATYWNNAFEIVDSMPAEIQHKAAYALWSNIEVTFDGKDVETRAIEKMWTAIEAQPLEKQYDAILDISYQAPFDAPFSGRLKERLLSSIDFLPTASDRCQAANELLEGEEDKDSEFANRVADKMFEQAMLLPTNDGEQQRALRQILAGVPETHKLADRALAQLFECAKAETTDFIRFDRLKQIWQMAAKGSDIQIAALEQAFVDIDAAEKSDPKTSRPRDHYQGEESVRDTLSVIVEAAPKGSNVRRAASALLKAYNTPRTFPKASALLKAQAAKRAPKLS